MPIRRIDDEQINAAVADARRTMVRVNTAIEELVANGIEHTITLPGLHVYAKLIFGDTFVIRSRVSAPVSAVADPPSATPPQ